MSRLLEIFRPNKRRIWQALCDEIGADFIPGKGFKGRDTIQAYHKNWTIVIDTVKRPKRPTFTRIRAPYVNRDSFHFRIYRRNVGSGLKKMFGMEDILVGHKQFDRDFIIQGNDERKLKQLFSNQLIRQLISWQPDIHLESDVDETWMTDTWGQGASELSFKVTGVITDMTRLQDLYDLFSELLNHLCHIGSAYEDDPLLL